MEKETSLTFDSREARNKHISKTIKQEASMFYSNLAILDWVDVYVLKSKSYKIGKIIEKHKKGFFILLDGYGEAPTEDNVSLLFLLHI